METFAELEQRLGLKYREISLGTGSSAWITDGLTQEQAHAVIAWEKAVGAEQ